MKRGSGFTLIEIIITIVVVAIAATALLSVFSNLVRGSADPVIQQQATTIAEAYMEEIMLRSFDDPEDPETQASEGEARADYDDVKDYRDLATAPAADQSGVPIPELSAYSVAVSVTSQPFNGIVAADSLYIEVAVTHAAIGTIRLGGYRTNY